MTVAGISKDEYELFKKNGGNAIFIIDANDISENKEFEGYPSVKPKLKTGFELPRLWSGHNYLSSGIC